MRYALYFTPGPSDPLTRTAAHWLGRDAFGGEIYPPRGFGGLDAQAVRALTEDPRRYGFHATLKAPFRLAAGTSETDLLAALAQFSADAAPVSVPEMVVGNLDGFFAIVPKDVHAGLDAFAGKVVTGFEKFRAPLGSADIARRNPERLSPAQLANLNDWGYPYVFDQFRFHMTLTGRITAEDQPDVAAVLEQLFTPLLSQPFAIDMLALFVEPEPGAPFIVRAIHRLGDALERKTA